MRVLDKHLKRALSLVLCLVLLISALAFTVAVSAEEVDGELAEVGADTYYLWGENTNSPNFSGSTPTGTFTYDSSKGYYYYDLKGSSGDYCFVVSTVGNSATYAVKTPAVQSVQSAGSYYVSLGNYHGFNCMHLWNPSGDEVRLYFTSAAQGMNAVKAGAESATTAPTAAPTAAPTQKPTSSGGTNPTTAPTPTTSPATPSDSKNYVYCENEAGWSKVCAYMWNSSSDTNAGWPGAQMTNIGGNIWRYEFTKSYKNIIFNIGSNATQTNDLVFPGAGYIYNNQTGEWSIYDTSPLQVSAFVTDLPSPQYDGVSIVLSAEAEGEGTVYYKFSASSGSNTVVISDYSTKNSVRWTPNAAGTYTLTYEFRDAKGNTNKRTKEYTITSGLTSVSPYIKTVTPAGGEIQRSNAVNLSTSAGGGLTGTKLLFYKYTVYNASGTIVNVPYYKLGSGYSFTPDTLGAYSVTVSVQGSDNQVAERTYNFECVGSLTPTEPPATEAPTEKPTEAPTQKPTEAPTQKPTEAPTQKPTEAPTQKPTEAPTQKPTEKPTVAPTESEGSVLYGDADDDGEITIVDATYIQRYDIGLSTPKPINLTSADVDFDGDVTINDCTLVRRYLLGLITEFKRR